MLKHAGFRIKTYLEYRKRAVNQYGLHSPFLYELYLACFRPAFKHDFRAITNLRKELRKSTQSVEITDFGAGSLVNKSSTRSVSEMYSSAAISEKQGELLHRLVGFLKPVKVLELGTHLGLSSAYMASGNAAKVVSLEGCPNTADLAQKHHTELGLSTIQIEVGDFKRTLPEVLNSAGKIDLAYVDGNHSYKGTLWNYEQLLPFTTSNSVIIFDDINWSPDMKRAWEEIIARPEVSISVNCFKFGMVFFREGVEKQDFWFKF
ncbi:MAG: O-methyltransferase [Flavobacteriales bacterium]